jgi:putative hydrolase of the HAD superfamily
VTDGATGVRGVVLDFGGVLWNMRGDAARALEREHELPARALLDTLYRSLAWAAVERGQGDVAAWRADAHARLEALAGRSLPGLHDRWLAAQGLEAASVALLGRLRPGYRVAILSNAEPGFHHRLRGLGLHDLVDAVVASGEEGLAKPDPAIYLRTAERLALPPEACVFIDDLPANVEGAVAAGMRGRLLRLHRGETLASVLEQFGIHP